MPDSYEFHPASPADTDLLRGWLEQAHVRRWWGDPDHEISLIKDEFGQNTVDMRIVYHRGVPFGFVQDYAHQHWELPQFAAYPAGARAVDTFIGAPEMLAKGHGWRFLRQRAQHLRRQFPAVLIDPEPDNNAAIHAYRRAGFTGETITPCEDGSDVLVLEFKG